MSTTIQTEYLIIGAGIIGLGIARSIIAKIPNAKVIIIEKEDNLAKHSSGRSSGVLHAGFYYTADSLKAKFSVDGNKTLTEYCEKNNLPISKIGKLVVATNETELSGLEELERRGRINGCTVQLIDEKEVSEIDPNAKTFQKALWSPKTSTIDPIAICKSLANELITKGVQIIYNCAYIEKASESKNSASIKTSIGIIEANKLINTAGLYSDKIAKDYGWSQDYSIVPFKGLYLKYTKNKTDIKTNIYPVPNLNHTFLGVHFTKTVDGTIKIGPTATPAFWRGNYTWNSNFKLNELTQILSLESKLFLKNSFGFRDLAFEEMKKYSKKYLISLTSKIVKNLDPNGFTEFSRPGMRAQLVNTRTLEMIMDFIIEGDKTSVHILNAISPGFTCSLPFADYVVENYVLNK